MGVSVVGIMLIGCGSCGVIWISLLVVLVCVGAVFILIVFMMVMFLIFGGYLLLMKINNGFFFMLRWSCLVKFGWNFVFSIKMGKFICGRKLFFGCLDCLDDYIGDLCCFFIILFLVIWLSILSVFRLKGSLKLKFFKKIF